MKAEIRFLELSLKIYGQRLMLSGFGFQVLGLRFTEGGIGRE